MQTTPQELQVLLNKLEEVKELAYSNLSWETFSHLQLGQTRLVADLRGKEYVVLFDGEWSVTK